MDRILIRGGKPLQGAIRIGGAKNAALPLMTASLLTEEPLTLQNSPSLADIKTLARLLEQHGVRLTLNPEIDPEPGAGRTVELHAPKIASTEAPYDLVRRMRASILVLGPLLARCGRARVSLPGGCAIGPRPVDLHMWAMEQLGAELTVNSGYIEARAPGGLRGGEVNFTKVSVGATENVLMAASLARGTTIIRNAAREPEIMDLGRCLIAMGANIEGLGTDQLTVSGVERLNGVTYRVIPDRIETGTYAMAAAITGGDLVLKGATPDLLPAVNETLLRAGVEMERTADGMRVTRRNGILRGVDVMTEPFPGFPTDLQAQMMALMSVAEGAAMITETIFENRFMHAPELMRMGADITIHHASALVRGARKLTGAPVMATDLRASVSLVLAGLAAEGETIINRVYHLDRGYEALETKLAACGADIERVS